MPVDPVLGDQVSQHWTVARIDTRRRVVTLAGSEGRTINLMPQTPSQER